MFFFFFNVWKPPKKSILRHLKNDLKLKLGEVVLEFKLPRPFPGCSLRWSSSSCGTREGQRGLKSSPPGPSQKFADPDLKDQLPQLLLMGCFVLSGLLVLSTGCAHPTHLGSWFWRFQSSFPPSVPSPHLPCPGGGGAGSGPRNLDLQPASRRPCPEPQDR